MKPRPAKPAISPRTYPGPRACHSSASSCCMRSSAFGSPGSAAASDAKCSRSASMRASRYPAAVSSAIYHRELYGKGDGDCTCAPAVVASQPGSADSASTAQNAARMALMNCGLLDPAPIGAIGPRAYPARRRLILEARTSDDSRRELLGRGVDLQVLDVLQRHHDQRAVGLEGQVARVERFLDPRRGIGVAVGDLLRELEHFLRAVGEVDDHAALFHAVPFPKAASARARPSAARRAVRRRSG